ncbi:MAG: hypothetical protein AAF065_08230 [Verrucomicrobiota bacterium]
MSLEQIFRSCLDLPGVRGAFCLTSNGELVENFMPQQYTDPLLAGLGERLSALCGAVDMSYSPTNEFLISFESNALYLRKNEDGIIGFFTDSNPHLAGLRVSSNLLLKQIKPSMMVAKQIDVIPAPPPPAAQVPEEEDDLLLKPANQEMPKPGVPSKLEQKQGLFGSRKSKKKPTVSDIWG